MNAAFESPANADGASASEPTQILLLTGPAGVGKSTLAWETQHQLSEAGIAHAIIETDELDRVFPKPTGEQLERFRPGLRDVSAANLEAIWSTYRALGHTRLIMSGVMVHLAFDRAWILDAIPDARITVVRLTTSEETLVGRLRGREVGSGAEAQIARSLRQKRRMDAQADDALAVPSDGRTVAELAITVLQAVGWLDGGTKAGASRAKA